MGNCDDLISRQAAIDALDCINGVEEVLKSLPSAEPERKTGKWMDTDNYYQRWKCSVCGCHTRDAKPPYCSHCGARMESK
jgi:rubrerythrin